MKYMKHLMNMCIIYRPAENTPLLHVVHYPKGMLPLWEVFLNTLDNQYDEKLYFMLR